MNNKYKEDQLLEMIRVGKIKLIDCWNTIDKDNFRNIRSGLIQERSPIEQRDPRLRRYSRGLD